jgi:UDP-glucose:(heptosyl)LPS alpha-1,3-glucosyltransferase
MRVGLLIDRWDPRRGGAERALDQLARYLDGRGHEVHVFGERMTVQPPGTFHAVRGGSWFRGGWSRGARERRLGRGMLAAARGVGCDVTLGVRHLEQVDLLWLHGGCHRATLDARRRAALGAAAGPAVPRGRHRAFDQFERTALEGGARLVVCPSPLVREELLARYPDAAARLEVVPGGVDLERFHPRERERARRALGEELGLPRNARLIVLPARNPRLKGWPELQRAYRGLVGVEGEVHLLLAGPRRAPRGLRRRGVGRRGVRRSARIHWHPHLDPLTLAAGADLCALPTWRDTFGLALVEAMACGTPVLTTVHAGAAAWVTPEAGAAIDGPLEPEHLVDLLERTWQPNDVRQAVLGLDLETMLAGLEQRLLGLAGDVGAGQSV